MKHTLRTLIAALGVVLTLGLPAAALDDVARPDDLIDTLQAMKRVMAAHPDVSDVRINIADQSLEYRFADQESEDYHVSYPDNLHNNLRAAADDAERAIVLEDFKQAMLEVQNRPEMTLEAILPVIRAADFTDGLDLPSPLVSRSLAADLTVYYVHDTPYSMSYVDQDNLADLGVTDADLHQIALDNAHAMNWQPKVEGNDFYVVTLDGNYEASLLLFSEIWNGVDGELGRVGAIAPSRDVVIFGDLDLPGVQGAMETIVAENYDTLAYQISPTLLEWTAGGWVPADQF